LIATEFLLLILFLLKLGRATSRRELSPPVGGFKMRELTRGF